jgi:ABC-2 type transporter
MIGFEWTAAKFFWYLFFAYFTMLYFTYYGMMSVGLTPNYDVAAIVSSAFYGIWNLFSGFLISKPVCTCQNFLLHVFSTVSITTNGHVFLCEILSWHKLSKSVPNKPIAWKGEIGYYGSLFWLHTKSTIILDFPVQYCDYRSVRESLCIVVYYYSFSFYC